MSNIAIQVENLGKLYRLGQVGTGTISHDLNRWLAKMRGKQDPFAKIGETNDRTQKGSSDYVWALQDVNFEIKKGEAVGIIGRNGAGKSTLLKLLSKVTQPSTGIIRVNGRIASLLEVGTGFHPELSGRDNIYLNGAIMGMTKREIRAKFDEIVDFAGVERYVDTPVKRYSSGMYVRLAFAVAAFLEPEILIVDEVLAVGDAEFQKKCLGKMKDVSAGDGRTVLFVSHNMEAVQNLCTSGILMQNGKVIFNGDVAATVTQYISKFLKQDTVKQWSPEEAPGNSHARLLRAEVKDGANGSNAEFFTNDGFELQLQIDNLVEEEQQLDVTYHLVDERGILIKVSSTAFAQQSQFFKGGTLHIKTAFPGGILNEGIYTFSRILLVKDRGQIVCEWNDVLTFEVMPEPTNATGWQGGKEGVLKITTLPWHINLQPHLIG